MTTVSGLAYMREAASTGRTPDYETGVLNFPRLRTNEALPSMCDLALVNLPSIEGNLLRRFDHGTLRFNRKWALRRWTLVPTAVQSFGVLPAKFFDDQPNAEVLAPCKQKS
jgi:hypothetical protein